MAACVGLSLLMSRASRSDAVGQSAHVRARIARSARSASSAARGVVERDTHPLDVRGEKANIRRKIERRRIIREDRHSTAGFRADSP